MKPELDSILCRRYPEIFKLRNSEPGQSAMAWGFECQDGWFPLIDKLCAEIQSYVNSTGANQIIASQVKEKYGALRFYYNGSDPMIDQFVDDAELRSEKICEVCGETGSLIESERGWLRTRCATHLT